MTTELRDQSGLADDLLQRVAEAVGGKAKASTVFGEPVERAGVTVIPVAKARFGFGGGGGVAPLRGEEGAGGGGGGGAVVSPVGYIEVREGRAEFKRITTTGEVVLVVAVLSLAAFTMRRLLVGE